MNQLFMEHLEIFIPIKDHFEQEDNAREIGFKFEDIFNLKNLIEQKTYSR